VGAHYDAAGEQPGADDNASGVAGVIELARLLRAAPPPMRVELAAWTLEEPPNFRTARMGSAVHAARLARMHSKVRLMISVEMIGTFSDAAGSQSYPPLFGLFYPSTGNFAAVVGKWGQGDRVVEVADAMRAGSSLPIETLTAPSFVTGVDLKRLVLRVGGTGRTVRLHFGRYANKAIKLLFFSKTGSTYEPCK